MLVGFASSLAADAQAVRPPGRRLRQVMNEARDEELRRLTEVLRHMATAAGSSEQVEALRKGAAALYLVFARGSWQELEAMNGPMTEEMMDHLRRMGLDPERGKS